MVTVIGVRKVNFTTQDGNIVKGRTVYIGFEANDVDGMQTDKVFLSDTKFGTVDIAVGLDYNIFYNRYGKVESMTKA